jgi:2-polyprenyl-6-methoxyphenol hydroxylase-like FAD-dependent oxidoreductase
VFDVAIVGGRPAGASLAARLGAAGLRVLVIDKDEFPSRPAVSAPFVLPHTMALLDELDVRESEYAADTPRMHEFVLEFGRYFRAQFQFEQPVGGRRHFYAIDRARFDHALWRSLARLPNVTALPNARAQALIRDQAGHITGLQVVVAGEVQEHAVRGLVGADGRHSWLARAVEAPTTDERRDVDTTIYYAHWANVAPYAPGPAIAHIHGSVDGFSFVLMPTADGETMVVAQGRADRYAELGGTPQEVYAQLLRARPLVWRRLAGATQLGELRGMKRIGNSFRAPGGPRWALVGDAYHQKDSIDAQGIYDALLGAKLLAEQLIRWHGGACTWDQAIERYGAAVRAAMLPMFEATMARVQREIYDVPPPAVAKTLLRWVLTHPAYGRRFTGVITRQLDPAQLLPPPIMLSLAARGALARLATKLGGRPDPTAPLELEGVSS